MKYFKTDGIRGEPLIKLTPKLLYNLGASLSILKKDVILLGCDTRYSKDYMVSIISSGIMACGIDVYFLGVVSTPTVIYLSRILNLPALVITASHNNYKDNGIKVINNGNKIDEKFQEKIECLIDNGVDFCGNIGRFYHKEEYLNLYLKHIKHYITKSSLKLVIDCANGATSHYAKKIFNLVSDKVIYINDTPNGKNINLNCGALCTDEIKLKIKQNDYDLGIVFDGDADRLVIISRNGKEINGSFLAYLFVNNLFINHKDKIVALSKMTNKGVIDAFNKSNIKVILTDIGDKYLVEEMINNNALIAAEDSGHILIKDITLTGDGLLNSLILIKILENKKINLDEYFKNIKLYPELKLNIKTNNYLAKIEKINKYLDKYENVYYLVRKSGTEDLLRILVDCKDSNLINIIHNDILKIIN